MSDMYVVRLLPVAGVRRQCVSDAQPQEIMMIKEKSICCGRSLL